MNYLLYITAAIIIVLFAHAILIALTILRNKNFLFIKNYNIKSIAHFFWLFRILMLLKVFNRRLMGYFININNKLVKIFSYNKKHSNVLIVLPRCLQYQSCAQAVVESVENCKICGKCDLAEIKKTNSASFANILVATGGEIAKSFVSKLNPDFVIAIACEREIFHGLAEVTTIPVFAIINYQPEGPCKNTRVDVGILKEALAVAGI
ncbi:MAG: DUF116 domain-containing protein [bacterium]